MVWEIVGPPSAESRLNRIYPQNSTLTQNDLSYTFRVQSEFPFIIATGNRVTMQSGITQEF